MSTHVGGHVHNNRRRSQHDQDVVSRNVPGEDQQNRGDRRLRRRFQAHEGGRGRDRRVDRHGEGLLDLHRAARRRAAEGQKDLLAARDRYADGDQHVSRHAQPR